jgi:hypothetical protein
MFDPASLAAVLGSVKNLLDLAKNANDAQLAIKISAEVGSIQGKLLDVQQQALSLQTENQQLRGQIEKARSYVQHHSVIWKRRPDETEDGPFCPACIGEDREMRLILRAHVDQTSDCWLTYCPKGHVATGATKHDVWQPKQEPHYAIPKSLLPENYFFQR